MRPSQPVHHFCTFLNLRLFSLPALLTLDAPGREPPPVSLPASSASVSLFTEKNPVSAPPDRECAPSDVGVLQWKAAAGRSRWDAAHTVYNESRSDLRLLES